MASCSSVLSEQQFLCSICQDVLIDPVSTQCGHNFCKACLTMYWDTNDLCWCPMCKKTFDKRPDLFVNTFISELVAQFRKSMPVKAASSPDLHPTKPPVSCDFCTGTKLKALKSCLVCVASYCETHLKPHMRVLPFKKHKLIPPVENLEDRLCRKHERPLELFCRTDQMCVCQFCTEGNHKNHDTVPLEQECRRRKTMMKNTDREVRQMIQERREKVQEIKFSQEISKRDAEREISDSLEVFTTLVRSIERSQAELIEVIEENQKAAEKQAEGFIKDLEKEITDLNRRRTGLELLSHTEDHLQLLQAFLSLSTPPPTRDWPQIRAHSDLRVETVRRAVSQLGDSLNTKMEKLLEEVKMRRVQQYAVDVTLDPDTAHHTLILSKDRKQVRHGETWKDLLPSLNYFFDQFVIVMGKQSLSSGRFYYEVQVEGKTGWVLGVARESIYRNITLSPEDGYWTIRLRNGNEYKALEGPSVPLSLNQKPQKVGVFVDYEEGQVSFYDVEDKSHIYSFTGCTFTEKVYPYFSLGRYGGGKNSSPFIITPVNL